MFEDEEFIIEREVIYRPDRGINDLIVNCLSELKAQGKLSMGTYLHLRNDDLDITVNSALEEPGYNYFPHDYVLEPLNPELQKEIATKVLHERSFWGGSITIGSAVPSTVILAKDSYEAISFGNPNREELVKETMKRLGFTIKDPDKNTSSELVERGSLEGSPTYDSILSTRNVLSNKGVRFLNLFTLSKSHMHEEHLIDLQSSDESPLILLSMRPKTFDNWTPRKFSFSGFGYTTRAHQQKYRMSELWRNASEELKKGKQYKEIRPIVLEKTIGILREGRTIDEASQEAEKWVPATRELFDRKQEYKSLMNSMLSHSHKRRRYF